MLVMEDYYEDMTLPELKELLKASNLYTSGNKATAVKRLREANWLKVLLASIRNIRKYDPR